MLKDKKGLIFGVANKRSIAWAIAQACSRAGARLAFTYQGEKLKEKVEELTRTLPGEPLLLPCDVTRDEEVKEVFDRLRETFSTLDFLVHSIAFANREDLEGQFINTSRAGYLLAQEISSYSLTLLAREAAPLMASGGSILTMTYLGGERVVPGYNVMGVAKAALESSVRYLANDLGPMGIRVNAISAGPINTLAARGISGFTNILAHVAEKAPLRRNVEIEEVAHTALFLASPLSSGITGEVIYVDCGFHLLGL
ncbi:MAG: enoyl-ACP reductase [Planctomycetes bacterium]|nr:enoyl-ACP reductase [Planctomycetota bacterium]